MSDKTFKIRRFNPLLFLVLAVCLLPKDYVSAQYSVRQVQDSLTAQYGDLEDYMVRATLSVQLPNFRMPRKIVDIAFKRPDLVKVEADGFAAIPKMGVNVLPNQIFDMLQDMALVGEDGFREAGSVIIEGRLEPDTTTGLENPGRTQEPMENLRARLWINTDRWVIDSMATLTDTTVISSVRIAYETYEQNIPLPQQTVVRFRMPANRQFGGSGQGGQDPDRGPGSPMTQLRKLENIEGTVIIEFGRYRVNTGINKKFFEN